MGLTSQEVKAQKLLEAFTLVHGKRLGDGPKTFSADRERPGERLRSLNLTASCREWLSNLSHSSNSKSCPQAFSPSLSSLDFKLTTHGGGFLLVNILEQDLQSLTPEGFHIVFYVNRIPFRSPGAGGVVHQEMLLLICIHISLSRILLLTHPLLSE